MIFVEFVGRLGNQMFQYAFARALQEERPDLGQIICIPKDVNYEKYGGITILDFAVNHVRIGDAPELTVAQRLIWRIFCKCRDLGFRIGGEACQKTIIIKLQPVLNRYGIYSYGDYDDVRVHYNTKCKNVWINGYWENPIYFNRIKTVLKKEFTPLSDPLPHNKELLNRIITTNSVCVSVRRGDFLSEAYKDRFNVCTKQYFYEAERVLAKRFDSYQLFIFSDDVEWCRKNLSFKGSVYYENNNGDDPVWEKIRLMTACKHFIISNSTFSWWAQFLSDSPDKVVIAPRPWRKNEYHDCLYDESFILLDGSNGNRCKTTEASHSM